MSGGRITNKARVAAHRQLSAQANGRASRLLPVIEELNVVGITSMRGIAAALDERGIATARGGPELSSKVGDGPNREGGISWGCLTPPLLHRRSDMPCPTITLSN
jgi:hypothetical protein